MVLERNTKIAFLTIICLVAFLTLTANRARALESGKVILDKDFGSEAVDYLLKTQPIVAGPFTGAKLTDMQEILPFYTNPLSKYTITVSTAKSNGKQNITPAEPLVLNGKVGYVLDSQEVKEALGELKNCKDCSSQDIYRFSLLTDVGIFAQVWRRDSDPVQAKKGDFLIDEFYAARGINLAENEAQDFQLKWESPADLKAGDYYVLFFLNSHQRFTLAGSPLVAFDQAAVYDFSVSNSESGGGLELDKNNIEINNQAYVYRQPAPEVTPDNGKITVSVPLTNFSPSEQNANVSYNLFAWGQEDPLDLVSAKQENKSINAGDKADLEFTFNPEETGSVYNLKIKVAGTSSLSTANIRLVIKGANRGIIRFLGQAQNDKNEKFPIFCLRNATWETLFHGKVKINAWDKDGKIRNTFEKEGQIRPEDHCFVITDSSWLADGSVTKLVAEMFNANGVKVDEKTVELVYPSKKTDMAKTASLAQNILPEVISGKVQVVLWALLIILVVIGGYLVLHKK